MQSMSLLRRWIAALVIVVPVAASSLPALASESTEFARTRDAWSANRDELAEASASLEAIDAATADATEEYQAVEARLGRALERLAELREELKRAIKRLAEADRANDVAIRRLGQATLILVTIEDALAEHADDLDVEVVAAYKYAGSSARFRGVVDALQKSNSITEFTQAYEQLRSGTVSQANLVDSVTALATRLDDQRVIVRTLQRETDAAEDRARSEREVVAELTQEQAELVGRVRSDRRRRKELLAGLKAQQAEYDARVKELAAESDALMEELRKYRYVGGAPGDKDLLWPTDGRVTSPFGYRMHPIFKTRRLHAGVDIPGPTGQPIYAAADGTVVRAGGYGGYGNAVVIQHEDGMSTVYAHQARVAVSAGEEVLAGDTIGYVGSTGNSTGPHVHFEIRLGGRPTDPLDWY